MSNQVIFIIQLLLNNKIYYYRNPFCKNCNYKHFGDKKLHHEVIMVFRVNIKKFILCKMKRTLFYFCSLPAMLIKKH